MAAAIGMIGNPRPHTLIANGVPVVGERRTYVVCGAQRGGTSAVAAVLRALGVDMGNGGFNHEDPEFLECKDDIEGFVGRRNVNPIWSLKIPHFALSLVDLTRQLRSPVIVLTFRNPVTVVNSLIIRGDDVFMDALRRIQRYFGAMLGFAQTSSAPVVMVSYERATANPAQFVDELSLAFGNILCVAFGFWLGSAAIQKVGQVRQ
jgi:hypothetical protein